VWSIWQHAAITPYPIIPKAALVTESYMMMVGSFPSLPVPKTQISE
jgi:hypothetical protein